MSDTSELQTINTNDYNNHLQNFETTLTRFLDHHGLPSEKILVTVDERMRVISNFAGVVSKIEPIEREQSLYLSKFTAAVASGLFDAALSYLWDETIMQIRKRIVQYDLDYFYDNAITSADKRKQFTGEDDLKKVDNYELIRGSREIGLISEMGFKHLEYINYMRNWASSAHPNQNEITGLQLVGWMETCIKEVISLPIENITIKIKHLLTNIKSNLISNDEAREIAAFFTNLTQSQVNNLVSGMFGIYVNPSTPSQTLQNINIILPSIWGRVDEETRSAFGLKYANFAANNAQNEKNLALQFLQLVNAESYLPEVVLTARVETAIENLLTAHRQYYNFYNEPTFARELERVVGNPPKLPASLNKRYVYAVVEAFLTNGNGVADNAESIYKVLISNFDSLQANISVLSFNDIQISSKLQHNLCQKKFKELLNLVKPIITSPPVKELIEKLENFKGKFSDLKNDSNIKRAVENLNVLIN